MPSCRASGRGRPTGTGPPVPTTRPAACAAIPAKLLLDPYARAISGSVTFGPEVLGYPAGGDPDAPSTLDSAGHVPRSLVVDETHHWRDSDRPRRSYADTIIYEVHVKGFTMRHPGLPPELRGTYAGLGHEAAIGHLLDLGVTAVELLPVHESVPEAFLLQRGLTNYWGYNTIGYFAPHQGYSAAVRAGRRGGQVAEFKTMVDALHRAGLEVLLDVVFNHSAEGNQLGPTLCYRGLDNPAYYRLDPGDPRDYFDTTGCGNSLNVGDPLTLQLIMDSLRYWVTEMHVDGFRFDLAPTLARQEGEFEQSVGLPGHGRARSRGVAGQADRRTVGRRADGQLRPGRVPAAVAGVERQISRQHAGLLAQPPRWPRRVRQPVLRVGGPVRRRAAAADGLGEPDHRARRVHPARPGLLRRQAQRGQRGIQPRRDERQPLVELRCGGPDQRSRPCWPCARASPARC